MDKLEELYLSYAGVHPDSVTSLTPSGSSRRYYRMSAGDATVVGVHGSDPDENRAFIALSRQFRSMGLRAPEVYAVSSDYLLYLQEDLGDTSLFGMLSESREKDSGYTEKEAQALCRLMTELPSIQFKVPQDFDFSVCYPDSCFNARMIDFDLNYFKYCFLKTSGVEFNEVRLQDDFDKLREDLLAVESNTFMYRDFQARNIMVKDNEFWYIDFQGGRKGPFYYDLVSFVWQAKAKYPDWLKERMTDAYYESLIKFESIDREQFDAQMRLFVLFRTLQVLGAYGFRGRIEKKAHFLQSIPYAMDNLRALLGWQFTRYPYLMSILKKLCDTQPSSEDQIVPGLEVHVISFSYKKGIPEDYSGNGGGYVFDCRSVHNPGKYEFYRRFTGLDKEVKTFLEEDGEIVTFLGNVLPLVEAHAKRFVERGFKHLQICFGCTGGQHRSVYSAQRTAERLSSIPGVRVHLTHRELKIDKYL